MYETFSAVEVYELKDNVQIIFQYAVMWTGKYWDFGVA
jgi:hypothetical protein